MTVSTLSWRRTTVALLRLTILALRRLTILTLRWLTILALRSAVLALRTAVAASLRTGWHLTSTAAHLTLLVLGVVRWVDRTEDQFDHPQVRREIDRWVGLSHLSRFVLVVCNAISVCHTSSGMYESLLEVQSTMLPTFGSLSSLARNSVAFASLPTCANWNAIAPLPMRMLSSCA